MGPGLLSIRASPSHATIRGMDSEPILKLCIICITLIVLASIIAEALV